jgi:hypothetical protein
MASGGRWRRGAAAALLLGTLALAACAGRVWLDHESDAGATLHWYTHEASISEVARRAEAHCQSFGKRALLLDEFEDQDVTTAHFACRAS